MTTKNREDEKIFCSMPDCGVEIPEEMVTPEMSQISTPAWLRRARDVDEFIERTQLWLDHRRLELNQVQADLDKLRERVYGRMARVLDVKCSRPGCDFAPKPIEMVAFCQLPSIGAMTNSLTKSSTSRTLPSRILTVCSSTT